MIESLPCSQTSPSFHGEPIWGSAGGEPGMSEQLSPSASGIALLWKCEPFPPKGAAPSSALFFRIPHPSFFLLLISFGVGGGRERGRGIESRPMAG